MSGRDGTHYLGYLGGLIRSDLKAVLPQEAQYFLDFEDPAHENDGLTAHSTRSLVGRSGLKLCRDLALPGEIYYDQDSERD
jgi:hypothetical protein